MAGEHEALKKIVEDAAQMRKIGSFSDRHPMLGRMVKCHYCKARRREGQLEPCCNASYQIVNDRVIPSAATKGRRRNSHTHKGSQPHPGPVNVIHQRILEFQRDPQALAAAVQEMQFSHPIVSGDLGITVLSEYIPVFAEKYTLWRERQWRKIKRKAQRRARRLRRP